MAVEREGVEFCLLGPLEARRNGEPVPLGGAKQRALLARLLVDAPAVVSVDTLIDDLWGERPPDGALHTVQVFVSRLRKVLGSEALVTRAPGYLVVGDADVERFRQLVARARERRQDGRLEAAVAQLAEALALWRGPPLAEFAYEAFAASHIERLEEERLAALEERIELELELGGQASLVGELEELCGAQPLRERLHEFLMLALYRSGRQSEALQVYAELRQRLVEELGLDPGASIQALERRILQQDVTLDATASKRQPLPEGTVTFLFTDIEESTQRLHELGPDTYARALAEHRHLLRTTFAAHAGVEVDTQGDALFVAFPTALGALAAATQAQAELANGPLRVRMALHTGTPLRADEGYVGVDVHRAARIAAAGHGGQVLISASTASLVEDMPLRDLGEHRFKDLVAPVRLYQLGEAEFPPLRSLYRTNIPIPATSFLGRERELAELATLVACKEVRLITLTGPGGTGKTRLAAQAAVEAAERYPDGIFWVDLAALRDPALVLPTLAQTLESRGDVAEHIGDKRLLILFDNFEQVIDAADSLAELLASCPRLELLVTSREPLHLAGEQEYPVPPLAPDEGVDFFLARARAVDPAFQADDAVAAICRRLDELPLALELAAARVKVLSPEQILVRLERALPLLTGGRRDSPARQRTLEAAIAWSYELLNEHEQRLFARLSVFVGGCTLEAAEQVCQADLGTLASLVDKSLLRQSEGRFWMLETIREYASERLFEAGEGDEVRQLDADHLDARERLEGTGDAQQLSRAHATFVAQIVRRLDAGRPEGWLLDLEREHANLRAALDWAVGAGEGELALELAGAARTFWEARGHVDEGLRRLEAALALPGASDEARAPGLYAAGILHARALRYERAESLHRKAVELCRELGDEQGLARALNSLGIALYHLERLSESEAALVESLALKRRLGDERGAAIALLSLGNTAIATGDLNLAERHQREALLALRSTGDELGVATALDNLAGLRLLADDREGARVLAEESLAVSRRLGALSNVACALVRVGQAVKAADPEQAHTALAEALSLSQSLSEQDGIAAALEAFAAWWLPLEPTRAATLLGAAGAIRARSGAQLDAGERRALERVVHDGVKAMPRIGWEAALARGRELDVDAAVAIALEPTLHLSAPSARP